MNDFVLEVVAILVLFDINGKRKEGLQLKEKTKKI